MPSTYSKSGLELITTGEKALLWGDLTNINILSIEEAIEGILSVPLTATAVTLSTLDGVSTEELAGGGRHKLIRFSGTPGGTCTVTIAPNDMQKIYYVHNNTNETIILQQGSGTTVTVEVGKKAGVFCDGAGVFASVAPIEETSTWTYTQENTPTGGEGFTWFQPSTGYAHVWITGLSAWKRLLTENMTADDNDHNIEANGGYF